MKTLDIRKINRFAWFNDYSFDYEGYEISPIDGCYVNGYIVRTATAGRTRQNRP